MQMDAQVLTAHRQQIRTKTQIGKWLDAVTWISRLRAARRWSTFVIKQDFAWATLGEMATRPLSLGCPLETTESDYIAFGQERLEKAEIETCYKLGKSLQLSTQYDHVRFMSDSRLRDVGEEVGTGTLHAQDGTMLRYVGQ